MKNNSMNEIVYLYLIVKLIILYLEWKNLTFTFIELQSQLVHINKDLQYYLEHIDFNLIEL